MTSRPEPDQRSTCKWCGWTIQRHEGGPWERAKVGVSGFDSECYEAPNPDDGPMPGHEPGTAIVNRPGYTPPGEFEVIGYDEFDGYDYPLGDPIGTRAVFEDHGAALECARRHLEDLERAQPASSSGGQGFGGIQDRVYIIHPDGSRERVQG